MRGSLAIRAPIAREAEGVRPEGEVFVAGRGKRTPPWACWLAGGLCVALAACSSSGGSGDERERGGGEEEDPPPQFEVNEGDVVAELELSAPQEQSFLLRATLPLPPRLYTSGDAKVPFVVANPDGLNARTQVVTASRYADAADGADVVELIARVDRPAGAMAGDRIRYKVAYVPTDPVAFDPNSSVVELLATPGALQLTTRDVFGNSYAADLWRDVRESTGEARTLKDGELARQIRTHEILLPTPPVSGSTGTLPHMMAAHAFLTQWSDEDLFSLDLHVHNGLSGLDKTASLDDALNEIYFDELVLSVPRGWEVMTAFEDPYFGASYEEGDYVKVPLVSAMTDGTLHVMPRQAHFVRRLVVYKESAKSRASACVRERWLAFCLPGMAPTGQPNLSWWSEYSPRYFPQRHRLPRLDHVGLEGLRGELAGEFDHFAGHVKAGTEPGYPVVTEGLGWAHPWGVKYGGMSGGDEIVFYDGLDVAASASQDGYRLAQLRARLYDDRQRITLYNQDGEPTEVDDWLVTEGTKKYMPMTFFLLPILPDEDVFGFNDAPEFQTDAVVAQGKVPYYQQSMLDYMAIDLQHYIRYTRTLKVLAWLGNDSVAKLDLAMAAACFHLGYHQFLTHSNMEVWGLTASMEYVEHHPGWGLSFGRGQGWGLDSAVAAYAFGDDAHRELYYPWFETIADTIEAGQADCTGIIQATPSAKYVYRVMQTFEVSIVENALWGMRNTVFAGHDDARADQVESILEESFYSQISPIVWRDETVGPVNWMAVGSPDPDDPPYCEIPSGDDQQDPNSDHTYCWADLAYGYELTQDPEFLAKALQVGGGAGDLYDIMHDWGMNNIAARAPILALLQTLNGE